MFKSQNKTQNIDGQDGIIGKNIKITGDIDSPDAIILHGSVTGNISCAVLTIGDQGTLTGNVRAERVIVNGCLTGDVHTKKLTLQASACVNGEMHYDVIEVDEGAQLQGSFVQNKKAENKQADSASKQMSSTKEDEQA
jgi:cytoskeletal protein CcmA (bactofilin family)